MPCSALPCPDLPCPALPCHALPSPPLLALPCHITPCHTMFRPILSRTGSILCPIQLRPALTCPVPSCLTQPCVAIPCPALPCPACHVLPLPVLPCSALSCPAQPSTLPCLALPSAPTHTILPHFALALTNHSPLPFDVPSDLPLSCPPSYRLLRHSPVLQLFLQHESFCVASRSVLCLACCALHPARSMTP